MKPTETALGRRRLAVGLSAGAALLAGLGHWSPARAASSRAPLRLLVVPQFPATVIQGAWSPLIEAVGSLAGQAIELQYAPSIPEFETRFLAGEPDLVFLNPYHMVQARRSAGYRPLVRDGSRLLRGILVAQNDGPIGSVRDLDGHHVAFPAPNAFGASLYMRALLAENEHIDIVPEYVRTHANAYLHVLLGRAAAAGGIRATLGREQPSVRDRLRVIYETPGAQPHPLAAHPRVPAEIASRIATALVDIGKHRPDLLRPTTLNRPVAADYENDYAPLEKLGLERYVVKGDD
ncbi:MAG: phosphate/phosphite/phosphonate ABC transporter substrate-binding protein [Burkholderiaceae bacterium]|nr:phosphate/phosphite/phosphonate ABC transporter substrate-binding protein [Burkholderiaceae bacterium]